MPEDAERERKRAEEGRVEAEGDRRLSEGQDEDNGRRLSERGRVTAEEGRVIAEEGRESRARERATAEEGRVEAENLRERRSRLRRAEDKEADRLRLIAVDALHDELRFYRIRQWVLYIALFVGLVVVAWAGVSFAGKLRSEARTRGTQVCRLFVLKHSHYKRQLVTTLRYLADLSPDERKLTLNRAVLRGLPELREEIRTSVPPRFCHQYGFEW